MFNGTTKCKDVGPTTRLVDLELPPEFLYTFRGKALDVGTPLVEQGIQTESTIHVAPRVRGGGNVPSVEPPVMNAEPPVMNAEPPVMDAEGDNYCSNLDCSDFPCHRHLVLNPPIICFFLIFFLCV